MYHSEIKITSGYYCIRLTLQTCKQDKSLIKSPFFSHRKSL